MAKKNNNLNDFFNSIGANPDGATDLTDAAMKIFGGKDGMPDLSDLSKFAGTGAMGNPTDMLKSLEGILKQMPDVRAMDAKDVGDRTKDDASIIRNIFKDMPGLSEFVDKLTDDQINAGPGALFDLMEKKKKKAAKKAKKAGVSDEALKGAEDASKEVLDLFLDMAGKLIDEMDKVEKDHGIDTSGAAAARAANADESTKIKRSPLTAMVIGLILEMGGNPTDHVKQLNKIVKNPASLKIRTAKILKKITRGNPAFLNTYAYLCSADFQMENITKALAKDKYFQEKREAAEKSPSDHSHPQKDWKPGSAAKKVAKIKAKFKSGKRTPAETTDALIALTDSAGRNPLALLEILSTLSKDLPGDLK